MLKLVSARLGKSGRWALAIGLLASVFLVVWLWSFISALLLPAASTTSAQADEKQRLAELQEKFKQEIAAFDGRTVFYTPAAPGPPPAPVDPVPGDGEPAPAPKSYGGPAVIAMVNDVVWFADGTRIKVGESAGDTKVIKLNAPWDATLLWKGAEFNVKFFEKDGVVLAKGKSTDNALATPPSPDPNAAPEKPPAPKDAATPAAPADGKPVEAADAKKPPSDKPDNKPGEQPPPPGEQPPPPPPDGSPGGPPPPPPQAPPEPK